MRNKDVTYADRLLAHNVKRLRVDRGWTMDRLAEVMGVMGKSRISEIEAAKCSVTVSTIAKFAETFGCEPRELFRPSPRVV